MKKFLVCAIALAMVMSFSACQTQSVDTGSSVSERGPGVNSQESEEEESLPESEIEDDMESEESKAESSESEEESKAESESDREEERKSKGFTSDEIAEDGEYTYEDVTVNLPAGFYIYSDSGVVIAVPEDYPETNQNVTFTKQSGKIDIIEREDLESSYSTMFDGFSGIDTYKNYKIDGYDAQMFTYTVTMYDVTLNMGQVAVYLDDKAVIMTFTSEENENNDAMIKAMDSIRVED